MNHIVLNHQVFVDKIGAIGVVSHNAPYFGCCQEDIVGFFIVKKLGYSLSIT